MPTGNIQLGNGTIFFNGLSAGVATISEAEITTEGNFIEKDFKVINLSTQKEATLECSAKMKIPLKWKLRWKWDMFEAKFSAYRKFRKILKRIKELYKLDRKLKNENS